MSKSLDHLTTMALRRMCDKANGDWDYILRIHAKARELREARRIRRIISSLAAPHPTKVIEVRE